MKRRPVCLVCLLLMLCMYILDQAGVPLIKGNPLPEQTVKYIEEHQEAVVCGEIQRYQDTSNSLSVCLKQVSLICGSETFPIKNLKVFLKNEQRFPAGTKVMISGKLERPEVPRNPGEFDSRQYYACQHIYYCMKNGVITRHSRNGSGYEQFWLDFREKLCQIFQVTTGNDAGVFEAMLLGEKSDLDQERKMRYQMAGMIHILAISGLHIGMLGMGFFNLLKRVGAGNVMAGLPPLILMLQYGMLTGSSVSAMRAVTMFVLAVGARILGRTYDLLTALSLSAVLMLLDTPAYMYSSSFQLSFGAVAGLGITAPLLEEIFYTENKILKAFLSSAAVQLTTLPLVLMAYGEVSVAGIFLNLAVLPTVGCVLFSGLCCGILGNFSLNAALIAAYPGRILLWGYDWLCETAARLPFCLWTAGSPGKIRCVLYYVVLILGLMTAIKIPWKKVAGSRVICTLTLFAGIMILSISLDKRLSVACLDIGQGDGIVLQLPDNRNFLIDGGSSNKKNIASYQILPFLRNQGISELEGILVSHTDKDHISGVQELLELEEKKLMSLKIKKLFLPDWKEENEIYTDLENAAEKAGVQVYKVHRGQKLKMGEVVLEFLAPAAGTTGTDVNEDSMVVELKYRDFKGLFTGDIGAETEKKMLPLLGDVDFLKTAHHGSRYSTCQEFLDIVKPELAVISCSDSNTYGHPSGETTDRMEESGVQIEYTMKNGAITIRTDGERIWRERFVE